MKTMTLTHRARTARILVLSLLAGALVATGFASSAQAVGTASVSGVVAEGGTPNVGIPGAQVWLISAESGTVVTSTETNGSGAFSFTGLSPAHYTYQVYFPSNLYGFTAFYPAGDEIESASYFSVAAGQAVVGKDMVVARRATISGTVTSATSAPLAGISVSAQSVDNQYGYGYYGSATTDASGNFTIYGLYPGSFTISYQQYEYSEDIGAHYAGEQWNDVGLNGTPTVVTIAAGEAVTGKNAQLDVASHITGNIKGPGNANLGDIRVEAYDATTGDYVSQAYTDDSGNYDVDYLGAGSYTLHFVDGNRSFAAEWWDNQTTAAAASTISVGTAATVGGKNAVLAALVKTASVSGNVKGAANANLADVTVYLVDYDTFDTVASMTTTSNGNFSFATVPAGTYILDFQDQNHVYPSKWWSSGDVYTFTVANGQVITGKNVVLDLGATISGTVTRASDGQPLPYAGVVVYQSSGGVSADTVVSNANTDSSGHYSVANLPLGTYKVGFSASSSGYSSATGALLQPKTFTSIWSGGTYSYATAQTVTLSTVGGTVPNINASLVYPTFGDVTDPTSAFYTYIEWMSSTNISTGTPGTGKPAYNPATSVSRQAMASFLYKLSGDSFVPPNTPSFADVPTTATFYTAIEWMASQGISTGTPQSNGLPLFKPADPVSRSAMALFLSRYDGVTLPAPTTQSFADVPLSASSAAAIGWMKDTGISTGTPQSSGLPLYKPSDPVSRQAMAAFLYRLAHLPA